VRADATVLPFPDGAVDALLCAYVLFHLLDPAAGVREARRVLRPDGWLGTVTWANETPPAAARVWDETLTELQVPIPAAHGNHAGLDDETSIRNLLVDAGLRPTHIWRADITHRFTFTDFLTMRTCCGCNGVRVEQLSAEHRRRVLAEVTTRLQQLSADDFTFCGQVICATATR
jgi:ubiquinone/menaquinone biosynthesis C-methylase UbiE